MEIDMNIRAYIFTAFLVCIATGCSSIPHAAIDVNKQVSEGISAIGENGIK